jgi:hypothetical protein
MYKAGGTTALLFIDFSWSLRFECIVYGVGISMTSDAGVSDHSDLCFVRNVGLNGVG